MIYLLIISDLMAVSLERQDAAFVDVLERNNENIVDLCADHPLFIKEYAKKVAELKNKFADISPIMFLAKEKKTVVGLSIAFLKKDSFHIWELDGSYPELLEENESYAKEKGTEDIIVKANNVRRQLQQELIRRGYEIISVEKSDSDSRYNQVTFVLRNN